MQIDESFRESVRSKCTLKFLAVSRKLHAFIHCVCRPIRFCFLYNSDEYFLLVVHFVFTNCQSFCSMHVVLPVFESIAYFARCLCLVLCSRRQTLLRTEHTVYCVLSTFLSILHVCGPFEAVWSKLIPLRVANITLGDSWKHKLRRGKFV